MKLSPILAALLVLPFAALGSEGDPIETVTVSTTSALTTVDLDPGTELTVQCTVATRYKSCLASGSCTATASNLQLPAEPAATTVVMAGGHTRMAFLAGAGGTCKIYLNTPRNTAVFR